jgi:membrane protease YdiL (CAAX protease family)
MVKKVKKQAESRINQLEPIFQIWAWVLLVWSLYRYFIKLSEPVDEFIFKPLIYLSPVIWFVLKNEKRKIESLGLTTKNIFRSLYIGIGFGAAFAAEGILANILKNGTLVINPIQSVQQYGMGMLLFISIATAISEEVLNRGFLFNRLREKTQNLPYAVIISTVLFILLHVPILVSMLNLQGPVLIVYFVSNIILSVVNCMLYENTGSLAAPILVHLFWNMTVALYL